MAFGFVVDETPSSQYLSLGIHFVAKRVKSRAIYVIVIGPSAKVLKTWTVSLQEISIR